VGRAATRQGFGAGRDGTRHRAARRLGGRVLIPPSWVIIRHSLTFVTGGGLRRLYGRTEVGALPGGPS
jgi:hypothetical protein